MTIGQDCLVGIGAEAVQALVDGRHGDPFSIVGPHSRSSMSIVRALTPGAQAIDVVAREDSASSAASPAESWPCSRKSPSTPSTVPTLGASGAIAAVMGAFLITHPRDKIRTVLIIGWLVRVTFIPAALLIGFWFLIQLLSFGVVADVQSGGVAYVAHIAGMIFGAVTARPLEDPRRVAKRGED
jgi:Rhomboid family